VSAHHNLEVHFTDQYVDNCRPERIFFEKALYHVKEKLMTFEDDAYEWLVTSMYGCNMTVRNRYWRTGGFLAGLAMAHCHLFPSWVLTYFKIFRSDPTHPFIQGLNFFGIAEVN
jgi:hypothetical protein